MVATSTTARKGATNNIVQFSRTSVPNCFSLGAFGALETGFHLDLMVPDGNSGRFFPPQLLLGGSFVLQNKVDGKGCDFRETPKGGLVLRAEIEEIKPLNGGKSFKVLNKPISAVPTFQLLCINLGMTGEGIRLKSHLLGVNVWSGITGTADVIVVGSAKALVRFTEEGQYITAFFSDGSVREVVREDGALVVRPFSAIEMVEERIAQACEQMDECGNDERGIKRKHGILFGLINLFHFTRANVDVRQTLVDFLIREDLNKGMRIEAEKILRFDLGDHNRASYFSNLGTVIPMTERKLKGVPLTRRAKLAKRAEKQRDELLRRSGKKPPQDQNSGKKGGNKKQKR